MPLKRHEIPTHLNVEDRAFYGLSVRQLMLVTVGVTGAYGLWNQWADVMLAARLGVAVACLVLAVVLAFIRPGGRGFEDWAVVGLRYIALAKVTVWRPRESDPRSWRPAVVRWEELSPTVRWSEEER